MEFKVDIYNNLTDNYFLIIDELINFSKEKNIIPTKILFFLPIVKNYIETNKFTILQTSLQNFLEYKDEILNFSVNNFNIQNDKNIREIKNLMFDKMNQNKIDYKDIEVFELLLEIKDNSLKLNTEDKNIIKQYIELLIIILEKIKNLF